jgi:hypothetical protein
MTLLIFMLAAEFGDLVDFHAHPDSVHNTSRLDSSLLYLHAQKLFHDHL